MSTFLAYTSPARGHLFPILPALAELRRRGHDVHVQTLAAEGPRAEALGVRARAIAPAIEALPIEDWREASPLNQARRTLGTWAKRATHEVADLRSTLAELRPDAVLVDINTWGACAVAEASGVPTAIYSPYFVDLDLPGRPPFGMGLAPWPGPLGRLRDAVVRAGARFGFAAAVAELNALRRGLSLPALAHLGELTTRADRLLYCTVEAFEYDHGGWPANLRFVGPGAWEPPAEGAPDGVSGRPTVLVTCSTEFQDDGRLVEVALEALASEDVDVIATTAAVDPSRFVAPPNATVVAYAPHGPILRRAAVVVCHGGMGITQKALAAGVPVCVVPYGRDQHDVARHVERCGAGASVPGKGLTVDGLRQAFRAARERGPGARRLAAAYAAAGGPERAADELEGLAG